MPTADVTRDDRVLPATRWTAWVVVPVLAAGGVLLFGFPADTARLWAWPINPPMTALAMGGGYLAGAVFFARAARTPRWHEIGVGVVGASVLSILLLAATVLHWDKFTHSHPSFWGWLAVYVAAPVWLPVLWLRNRRHDPLAPAPGAPLVPRSLRVGFGAGGGAALAAALAVFARPDLAVRWWPWEMTPLTARSIAAFVAFIAVALAALLFEARWSALRLHVDSAVLGLALVAVGALRSPGDLRPPGVGPPVFAAVLAASIAALVWLRVTMGGRARPDAVAGGAR